MNKFMKKVRGGNGFTLVEMLIVVAIIAILIAISIPMVNSALDKAKHATDAANERAAKAEILIQFLADGGSTITEKKNYAYNAGLGSLVDANTVPTYGKHTGHTDKFIEVCVDGGKVFMKWVDSRESTALTDNDSGLCSATNH